MIRPLYIKLTECFFVNVSQNRGNIPVQNGVVHLIDKPLMIVARTLYEYILVKRMKYFLRAEV
jgi:hypothetical protein